MSIEKITSNDLKDLNIGLQIDKILNTQLQTYKSKPHKIESPFGDEMVKEYKNELNKPVIITDSFGNEQSFKYHPASSIPVFDPYVPIHAIIPSDAVIRQDMGKAIKLLNDETDRKNILDTEYRQLFDELVNLKPIPNPTNPQKKTNTARALRKIDVDKRMKDISVERITSIRQISGIEAEYKRLEQLLNDIENLKSDNQAEQSRIDTLNKTKTQSFIDEMNVLNSGSFNV